MKRLLIILSLAVFMLGSVVSAQAVNVNIIDGQTANTVFGNIAGVSQLTDQTYISALLSSQERYSAYVIGSAARANNYVGTMNGNSVVIPGNYSPTYFDKATGKYSRANDQVLQNVLLSDVGFESRELGPNTQTKLSDPSKLDTSVITIPGSTSTTGFQLYTVTAESVTINNVDFWRGTIFVAFEDGRYNHKDFNDLIIALRPNTPAVPIPASAFLLVPGLAGLRVLRKKMK